MDLKNAKTYTDHFHLAQQFFVENPGQQLKLDDWQEEINKTNATTKKKKRVIDAGGYKVTNASGATIPVLAAISLGATSEELAAVIKHHGLRFEQISDCIFEKTNGSSLPAQPDEPKRLSIDGWRVPLEVVKAMSQDPALYKIIAAEATGYEDYPALDIARLLSSNEDFWPVTSVRRNLAEKRAAQYDPNPAFFTDVYSFFAGNVNFDELTDAQVLTMIERSGHLTLGVNDENGFWCGSYQSFFNRILFESEGSDAKNIQRLIQALNAVEDQEKVSAITARLIEALPIHTHTYRQEYDGVKLLGLVQKHLDQTKYASVSDSMSVKIKMIPGDLLRGDFSKLDGQPLPQCLEVFVSDGATVFKRLHEELLELAPSAFKFSHFAALNKLLENDNTSQDLTGVDMPRLLNQVFLGLESFNSQTHYSASGSKTRTWVDEATEYLTSLIGFASKQPDLDYGRFQGLPSGLKALMASNGFDVKKLPGISNRDKGHVLDDGMGL